MQVQVQVQVQLQMQLQLQLQMQMQLQLQLQLSWQARQSQLSIEHGLNWIHSCGDIELRRGGSLAGDATGIARGHGPLPPVSSLRPAARPHARDIAAQLLLARTVAAVRRRAPAAAAARAGGGSADNAAARVEPIRHPSAAEHESEMH